MGREWYWGGRSSSKRGGGEKESTPSGCMSAVLHFFDLHHSHLLFHHHQQQQHTFKPTTTTSFHPQEHLTILKGAEAPRNSLESEDASSSLSMTKEEENLNIPMRIQIKTSGESTRSKGGAATDLSSEMSSSPGTKTPNLVARLMGLDLLPDIYSPSTSSTPKLPGKPHLQHFRLRQAPLDRPSGHRNCMDHTDIAGVRSLPETPRISSARRSDVDHRLSLQINKENIEEMEFSRYSSSITIRNGVHDNTSPNHHARKIVKQVKENVSRKVGLDITNTVRNREHGRDDQQLIRPFKSKKISELPLKVVCETSPGKNSSPSFSPRLKILDSNNKPSTSLSAKDHTSQPPQQQQKAVILHKCKNVGRDERFVPRLKRPPKTSDLIRNKQEEAFVGPSTSTRANILEKNCKKTPLSSQILNITVPTRHPVKKNPQTQVIDGKGGSQLSSCLSQKYKQEAMDKLVARDSEHDRCNGAHTNGGVEEFQYVIRILRRTGIDKDTPVSFVACFSPSHLLDPFIFHHLELEHTHRNEINSRSHLNLQCNRRLIFNLVDEILIEILKPNNMKPWAIGQDVRHLQGSELIDAVCAKIKSFPLSHCRVLKDIDALIDKDLSKSQCQTAAMAVEEEGEGLVREIQRDLLDTLVHETTTMFMGV